MFHYYGAPIFTGNHVKLITNTMWFLEFALDIRYCYLIGERQEAQILKFNAPPPPTHLVCHVHLTANFLSFHMNLVVVVNCGAGNTLRGFEISMF